MSIGQDPGEVAYLGLTISYADRTESINVLERVRNEPLLEYDISGAITRLIKKADETPTIGVMSPLQLTGGFPPDIPPQMTRGQRAALAVNAATLADLRPGQCANHRYDGRFHQ